MGLRGPLRNQNSRNGKREVRKVQKLTAKEGTTQKPASESTIGAPSAPSELPTTPECWPRKDQELFQNLVLDLLAAKVPLKRVDAHAIAQAVRCISAIDQAEETGKLWRGELRPARRITTSG